MLRALIPVSALLLSVAILLTGNGLQVVLIPVRASLEGFGALAIGLIGSSYFLGFAIGCLVGPWVVARAGHIRVFTAMTALASTAALTHALLVAPFAWWVMRGLSGVCFAILFLVIESWLNERATRENRGLVLSSYMFINLTVITVGQLLLPLNDPTSTNAFAVVAILVSLAAIPVAMTTSISPEPIKPARPSIRRLYAISPAGTAACLAVGLANGAFWALGPLFARSNGLDELGIAVFMSATVIGGAVAQLPLGRMSDLRDRREVVNLAASAAVVAGLLMSLLPFGSTFLLMVAGALWGAMALPLYSLAVAVANDSAKPEDLVQVSGGLLLVYAAGAIVGPIVASAIAGVLGMAYLFLWPVVVHAALFVYMRHDIKVSKPVPVEEHVPFSDALTAAQTVSHVFEEELILERKAGEHPAHKPD